MLIPTALVRSAARILAVVLVFCAVLFSRTASAQNPRKPLSKDEVVELLKGGISSGRVADIAHDRGINFELTPEAEDELRGAGATDELIRTFRELAPKPAQIVVETSPDAQVYLDDTFVGQASSQGRLVIGNPKPGDHALKVSLAGRKDYQQPVTVVAGQVAMVKTMLEEVGLSPGTLPPSRGRSLTGKWRGTVTQDKPEPHAFPVTMELDGPNGGSIDYPSFSCGGSLEFRRVDGTTFWYTEHITHGKDKCIDGGTLKVVPQGNSLNWDWSGEGVTAAGTLTGEGGISPSPGALRVVARFSLPSGAGNAVDVDPTTNKVFTSGGASGGQQVAMIDGRTNKVIATLGTGSGAHVNPATGKVYAGGVYSGTIYVYSSEDGHLIAEIKAFGCPIGAVVDSSSNQVWGGGQCGANDDPAFLIDGGADRLASGYIGSGGVMSALAVNPVTHVLYVYAGTKTEEKIDPSTLVTTTAPFSAVVSAVNAQTNRMYGGAISGGGVDVIDGSTESVITTLPVSQPGAIAVNPTRNRVYVVDQSLSPQVLKVFDGATNALLGETPLPQGDSPAGLAVNSRTGTLYQIVSNPSGSFLVVLEDSL
jgi:DNA-binding beta-propeller fold protein YncE